MSDPAQAEPAPVADPAEPEGDADPLATTETDNYRRALAGGSTIHEGE